MLHLANATKCFCFEPPEDAKPAFYNQSGDEISHNLALDHSKLSWDIVTQAIKYSQTQGDLIPPNLSLLDYYQRVLEKQEMSESSKELVLEMGRMWGNIVGEPIEQQSLRYMWLEECIDGGLSHYLSTYQKPTTVD